MLNAKFESTSQSDLPSFRIRGGRWWRESEVLVLITLVAGAYFLRAGDLTIRGEESRRATVAREMIWTGDWIVPRQQGEPFLSRPPLENWLIAIATLLRGQCDVWAIRSVSITSVLLTTLLVYAFGRSFLSRFGAFAAGLAFCTMGEVLQMGRVAETDLLFTCLLSSAVIVWLWGERHGWPAWTWWCGGYALAALAALAKGPQAPVYFGGTIVVYLSLRRDWRTLFSRWHAAGIALFIAAIAAWQVPYTLAVGWDATIKIWGSDSAARFENLKSADVVQHLLTYPLEVLGCTAPWSLFLIALLSRRFRASLLHASAEIQFLTTYFVLGFLPCWASPGGMTRYCLPLYPALALLVGLALEKIVELELSPRLRWAWTNGWRLYAATFVILAIAVLAVTFGPTPAAARPWAQTPIICLAFAVAAIAAAKVAAGTAAAVNRRRVRLGLVTLAGFMALLYSGIIVNALVARSANAPAAMAALRSKLPHNVRLVSLNGVHHLFAYLYGEPIELHAWPTVDDPAIEWFCFSSVGDYRAPLPFTWEEITVIPVDRNWHAKPENIVVVGRRTGPKRD